MWQLRIVKGFSLALCLAGLLIVPACTEGFFSSSFFSNISLSLFDAAPADGAKTADTPKDIGKAHALIDKALALEMQGSGDEALKQFDAALALNALPPEESARAHFNRGVTREELGLFGDALADYNEALRLHPQFPAALNNRANLHRRMGDLANAKTDYEATLAAGTAQTQYPYYGLGQIAEAEGDANAAQDFYKKALAADPNYTPASERLAALSEAPQTQIPVQVQPRAHLTEASYTPADTELLLRPSILGAAPAKPSRIAAASPVSEKSGAAQIQLGAYRDEATATQDWNRLVARSNGLLSGLAPQIVPVDLPGKGRFFRLRTGGRGSADALCTQLKSHGLDCIPVKG